MIQLIREMLASTIFNNFETYANYNDLLDITSILLTAYIFFLVIRGGMYLVGWIFKGFSNYD